MIKVITYGTYDLLHHGHIRLLERARALGDYLIVGVTADDFDMTRGKINGKQTLIERIEAVRATGLADEIIVEEYQGQKIDDIQKYDVDIFTVGSDWEGHFDYLNDYCRVIYLPRTEGVSSTEIRNQDRKIRLGVVGESSMLEKFLKEASYVNGIEIVGVCKEDELNEYNKLLGQSEAVYVVSNPKQRFLLTKMALSSGKHVLCESPFSESVEECNELFRLANTHNVIIMEALKTAYSTAYHRLNLLAKSGVIGRVVSVEATCTSLKGYENAQRNEKNWGSLSDWGPIALLPVFQLLGTDYTSKKIISIVEDGKGKHDSFTKIDFVFADSTATVKVGNGVKSEGILVITGTKGYIYVPAPWWKTDYFEIRYENLENNKRYFYQLDGEGIRHEILEFIRSIEKGKKETYINENVAVAICSIIEDYNSGKDLYLI